MCITEVMSISVATLGILVVFLIGWNIFNYLSFEGKMKKRISKAVAETEERIEDSVKYNVFYGLFVQNMANRNYDLVVFFGTFIFKAAIKAKCSNDDIGYAIEETRKAYKKMHMYERERLTSDLLEALFPLSKKYDKACEFRDEILSLIKHPINPRESKK